MQSRNKILTLLVGYGLIWHLLWIVIVLTSMIYFLLTMRTYHHFNKLCLLGGFSLLKSFLYVGVFLLINKAITRNKIGGKSQLVYPLFLALYIVNVLEIFIGRSSKDFYKVASELITDANSINAKFKYIPVVLEHITPTVDGYPLLICVVLASIFLGIPANNK